jgi:hypothetical protein
MAAHGMLAAFASVPEMALGETESRALAEAAVRVAAHYPAIARALPPEALAWFNLAQVAAVVYVPRFVAIRTRQAQEAKDRAARRGNGMGGPVNPAPPGYGFGAVQ